MINPFETIKRKLDDAITQLCETSWMFTNDPSRDFTRTRKLPPEKIIRMLLCMEGKSLNNEILCHFNCSPDFATSSAFIQQRKKFNGLALPALFDLFVKMTDTKNSIKASVCLLPMDLMFKSQPILINQMHIIRVLMA